MDSSFLTGLHIGLSLFSIVLFCKMLLQFGLPNHPFRFMSYIVGLCSTSYFTILAATDYGYISPFFWMKWRALPVIVGGMFILLQTLFITGSFRTIQLRIMSRLILMASIIGFAFFSKLANAFFSGALILGGLFLIVLVQKGRFQKRLYFKMLFLFLSHVGLILVNIYAFYVVAELILIPFVFYVFQFEKTFCISALIEDLDHSAEGKNQ